MRCSPRRSRWLSAANLLKALFKLGDTQQGARLQDEVSAFLIGNSRAIEFAISNGRRGIHRIHVVPNGDYRQGKRPS